MHAKEVFIDIKDLQSRPRCVSNTKLQYSSKHSHRQGNLKTHYLKEVPGFRNLQVLAHNVCHCCTDFHIDFRV